MDEHKREHMETAGFVVGDFEQFATEVLGMSVIEARETQFRADLAVAICRLRERLKLTRPAFAKLVGLTRPELTRLEVAAPEVSLDLIFKVYFTAGGVLRYQFDSPAEITPASPPKRRKAVKA